jgi:hypothetical protein
MVQRDVARLKKLTRRTLMKEILREFQGDSTALVEAIDALQRFKHMSTAELEHYASTAGGCGCSTCKSVPQFSSMPPLPARVESSTGEERISLMLAMIEKWAPSMTPAQLKRGLLCDRMFRGRTDEELIHFVSNGYFLTHTPDQAEAEHQIIKIDAAQKKWSNQGGRRTG